MSSSINIPAHHTADPEFKEALMDCVAVDIGTPTDERAIHSKLPISVLEGRVVRDPNGFIPPRKLLKGGSSIRADQLRTWRYIADRLLFQAQQGALVKEKMEALSEKSATGIKNVRSGFSVVGQQNGYFDIHTNEMQQGDPDNSERVTVLTTKIRGNVHSSLMEVLEDADKLQEILHAASIFADLTLNVVFEDIINRLERIRKRFEDEEDTKTTFAMLEAALVHLAMNANEWLRPDEYNGVDCEGVTIDPDLNVQLGQLSVRDAVIYGCQGLYTPEDPGREGDKRATISLPMSKYGTSEMLTMKEKLEILAHELAHHLSHKKPQSGKPAGGDHAHDGQHEYWEHRILDVLMKMRFDWRQKTALLSSSK